jgi:hypothetical protein
MSGTVTPEFGVIVKVIVALLVFLGIEYLCVIIKLSLYDSHTVTWKIVFGLITPVVIILGLIISNLSGDKTINVVLFFLLTAMNLVYLLTPVTNYLTNLIYVGNNNIINTLIFGLISIFNSTLILSIFVTIIYFVLKK